MQRQTANATAVELCPPRDAIIGPAPPRSERRTKPAHGCRRSMSRRGNLYDNAHIESFFKTLKHEEIFANDYSTIDDLANRLPHFLEEVYNRRRLHSSLGYRPPEEFESVYAA